MFTYFGREENVYVKDGNSFHKYIFIKDENKHVFYVLFDKELDLTQDKEYKLTYIDNILLELENSNEKDRIISVCGDHADRLHACLRMQQRRKWTCGK